MSDLMKDLKAAVGWIRKQWSKLDYSRGLRRGGPWRVLYPDGNRTYGMPYGDALTYQDIYGGTLEYIPECEPTPPQESKDEK